MLSPRKLEILPSFWPLSACQDVYGIRKGRVRRLAFRFGESVSSSDLGHDSWPRAILPLLTTNPLGSKGMISDERYGGTRS